MLHICRTYLMLALSALVVALPGLFISQANADEITVTCPATINQNITDSVRLVGSGTCVLAAGYQMTNDVTVSNGVSFIVKGTVDGKITGLGSGSIVVNGGTVNNDVIETGSGAVRIINGGLVTGKIDESSAGSVVLNNGSVDGDVLESGIGAVNVIADSLVGGNVSESQDGSVTVDSSSLVEGNVFEKGAGNCNNVDPDSVEGVVDCD